MDLVVEIPFQFFSNTLHQHLYHKYFYYQLQFEPSIFTIGIKSFILFIHLKNVDFPQPDGPINAVILF